MFHTNLIYEFSPSFFRNQLGSVCVYDLEFFDRVQSVFTLLFPYRLSNSRQKWDRGSIENGRQKCLDSVRRFSGVDCSSKTFRKLEDLKG